MAFRANGPRLIERHLRHQLSHRERGGMKGDMGIGELSIFMPADFFTSGRAPGERRSAIEVDVFRRRRLDSRGRRHRPQVLFLFRQCQPGRVGATGQRRSHAGFIILNRQRHCERFREHHHGNGASAILSQWHHPAMQAFAANESRVRLSRFIFGLRPRAEVWVIGWSVCFGESSRSGA